MSDFVWTYDPTVHNYRVDGKFIAFPTIKEIVLAEAEASGNVVEAITRQLIDGKLKLDHWQEFMRLALKNEHLAQYMAGRGGKAQMTFRDYGIVGNILKVQYRFLDNFAQDIATGNMTPAQILARARMYITNAHQSFWRGRTEALGMPRLPTYPAEGDTQCLVNCRCEWQIAEVRAPDGSLSGWNATWVLDPKAQEVHCEDCPKLAVVWNPLWVPAGMSPPVAEAWRHVEREKVKAIIGSGLSGFDNKRSDLELGGLTPSSLELGGPGSGNWAHVGRPGQIGGSAPRNSGMSIKSGKDWLERYRQATGKEHPEAPEQKAPEQKALSPAAQLKALERSFDERVATLKQEMDGIKKRLFFNKDAPSNTSSDEWQQGYKRIIQIQDEISALIEQKHNDTDRLAKELGQREGERVRAALGGIPDNDLDGQRAALTADNPVGKIPYVCTSLVDEERAKLAMEFLGQIIDNDGTGLGADPKAGVKFFSTSEDSKSGWIGSGRSYHRANQGIFMSSYAGVETFVHEWGHHFEAINKHVLRKAVSFLARRTEGEQPEKLAKLEPGYGYRDDEIARPDKFFTPYCGKVYMSKLAGMHITEATEIVSMGIQRLYEEPKKFAKDDPEYFDFIVAVLRGLDR